MPRFDWPVKGETLKVENATFQIYSVILTTKISISKSADMSFFLSSDFDGFLIA